jgi:hypothetical protein
LPPPRQLTKLSILQGPHVSPFELKQVPRDCGEKGCNLIALMSHSCRRRKYPNYYNCKTTFGRAAVSEAFS